MIDLDQLEALAKAADQGVWCLEQGGIETNGGYIDCTRDNGDEHEENRRFVALCNPATLLTLIAEVRALRGKTIDACVEAVANMSGEEYSPIWNSAIADAVDRLNAMKEPK
ncbi:hypothetical protein [Burkholderia cepacia]|uniref:hypothetical protein n=1 Tax=Burkholderia cepacia TaxID=292 RepID=UPI000758170F|nr:hypothetical protein [Burkholderia cepacia]KWF90375.1 hypothetical protein WL95_27490 [Burkholderia cepacia]